MSMKNPLTPVGIEPATFRFVAQNRFKICNVLIIMQGMKNMKISRNVNFYRATNSN